MPPDHIISFIITTVHVCTNLQGNYCMYNRYRYLAVFSYAFSDFFPDYFSDLDANKAVDDKFPQYL
jgi:hypothetical protein